MPVGAAVALEHFEPLSNEESPDIAMGGSSSTRKITVVQDESSGVIKISDSVVKRLRGEADNDFTQKQDVERHPPQTQDHPPHPRIATAPTIPRRAPASYEDMTQQTSRLNKEREEEIRRIDSRWAERLQVAEEHSAQMEKRASDELARALNQVAALLPACSTEPVCPESQRQVLDCYTANPKTSLRCAKQAREYVSCVQQARLNSLVKG